MAEVRQAVLTGHKLHLLYASRGQAPRWCIVDPIGLVTVREKGYLLTTEDGVDRTFRVSRILEASASPIRLNGRSTSISIASGPLAARSSCRTATSPSRFVSIQYGATNCSTWPRPYARRRQTRTAGSVWRSPSKTYGTQRGTVAARRRGRSAGPAGAPPRDATKTALAVANRDSLPAAGI